MKQVLWIAAGILAAGIAALGTLAQEGKLAQQRLAPSEFPWSQSVANRPGSGMQPGLDTIFVAGDGSKHDLYSIVFKIPAHTAIQPHSHRDDRSCFVLEGHWYFAYGIKRDESKFKVLPPGSYYAEPGGAVHFAGTKDEPVLLECTGVGPTSTTFVNAADDPRNKK